MLMLSLLAASLCFVVFCSLLPPRSCPCVTFGENMAMAGMGECPTQVRAHTTAPYDSLHRRHPQIVYSDCKLYSLNQKYKRRTTQFTIPPWHRTMNATNNSLRSTARRQSTESSHYAGDGRFC